MLRALLAVGLAACAPTIHLAKAELEVQEHRRGPVRLVGFVDQGSVIDHEAAADFALVLPDGDWLAQMNGALVRLSSNGRTVRWTKRGVGVWDAVVGLEGRVICVGTIADPKAPNGAVRRLFMLDAAHGDIIWSTTSVPVERDSSSRVVHVNNLTIAASESGLTAVGDSGQIAWVVMNPERVEDPWIAPITGGIVVMSTPQRLATDFTGGPPRHAPLIVRTFDLHGDVRGRFELDADQDFYSIGQLGFSRDGRIALFAGDVRENVTPTTLPNGERSMLHSDVSTPKIVELDVRDVAKPTARATAITFPPHATDAMPKSLGPSEVAFVDGYANDGEALGLLVVDLSGGGIRRAPIVTSAKRDSHVQLIRIAAHRDRITFAGHFTGHAKPMDGRVETVDWCAAQHGVECFGDHEDPTLAPYAALIGTIAR